MMAFITLRTALITALIVVAGATLLAGCSREERKLPVTELPERPAVAEMPCEILTDDEIITCIKEDSTRAACLKAELNCARFSALKSFVKRTWVARDESKMSRAPASARSDPGGANF